MSRSNVTLYSFSFTHHGQFSSFHRLLYYAQGCDTVDVTFPFRGWFGPVWQRRLESRWQRWSEWRLRAVFGRRERQCIHYVYPENSLFRGAAWKGHHGLVLSCHQPAENLRALKNTPRTGGFFAGLACADRVVLLAGHLAHEYEEFCEPPRMTVIPHGVDVDFFQPAPAPPHRPLVLTVGNWLRDYGLWAETTLRLADQNSEVEFAVVALPEVVREARQRVEGRFAGRVRFLHGLTDEELRQLYQQTTVLFLPLKDAGANNALLESMASGIPIVVSDLPATREYAGDCAIYFNNGALDDCLSKLINILSDGGRRAALGSAARARAVGTLAWKQIAQRYASLYAEVLEK